MLYKISEFSAIAKISSRMLRFLDQEGILKPKTVDVNGYRYYSEAELVIAGKINRLRRYHFTYQEIKAILDNQLENDISIYRQKVDALKETTQDYEMLIHEIENLFEPDIISIVNQYDVNLHNRKPCFAVSRRSCIHRSSLENFIEDSINTVVKNLKGSLVGNYYISFYGEDLLEESNFSESYIDVCFTQPVTEVNIIEGFGCIINDHAIVLSTIHYGSYDQIYNAYLSLYHYIREEGYSPIGPYSEKYFVDSHLTNDAMAFVTEVSIVVEKND